VSNYNREYYKKHSKDWVTRKMKRARTIGEVKEKEPEKIVNEHNYWNKELRNEDKDYIVPDYEWAGEKAYDVINTGKETIKGILEEKKQQRIEAGTQSASIMSMIKKGLERLMKIFEL
jgi:hypothetical protein